jgi:hypothetical protein
MIVTDNACWGCGVLLLASVHVLHAYEAFGGLKGGVCMSLWVDDSKSYHEQRKHTRTNETQLHDNLHHTPRITHFTNPPPH